jgi:hypothetical protein
MTPELAKFIQELMQTKEARLEDLTMVLKDKLEEEREKKLAALSSKLKSRKA